jgi:hypothetical protein
VDQRTSDRHLDEEAVAGLIASQFPGLIGQDVTRLGTGWDHELFLAGEWILRFPKRAERVAWLTREVKIMPVVAETLGSMVWLCRVLTLTWLAEAAGHDPASVPMHLSWVSRAFSR